MRVDRLEISGFKSFVDPVTVEMAGGITSIVGPNGCGKSNLSDAFTWVLGEQSAKSLRGDTMEDVIFNGSADRKPLGMAEVSLTLQADPSFPSADDGRLTLGRRVFRNGESQYRLNGKVVRLKEIKDLLMDTGLGIRAYSVIEQGRIGMILSGKPQERRRLIEEAAGITRYKARKRLAEIKLEEARANLLRLDDVVGEVERALRSLKRQAAAARRYKEKQAEYRELLEQVLVARRARLDERQGALRTALDAAVAGDAERAAELHRREAALAAGREELDRMASEVGERHRVAADLGATIEGRQQLLKSGRERQQEIAERLARGRTLGERRTEDEAERGTRLSEVGGRRDAVEAELTSASEAVSRDEEEVRAAASELAAAERRREAIRAELLEAAAEANRQRQRLHQAEIELERANYRRHHLARDHEEHAAELAAAAERLETAAGRVAELERDALAQEDELALRAAALEALLRHEARSADTLRGLETALSESRQRRELLEELSRAHAERRTALADALGEAGLPEPSYLASQVRPLAGWERALDLYLGELADAVVLADDDDGAGARSLAASLALSPGGATGAHLLTPRPAGVEVVELDDPAIVLSLGAALGLPPTVAAALPPGHLVGSAADAQRLAHRHPGHAFLTADGIWFHAGVIHVAGERSEPGLLERERRLAELGEEIPRLEAELAGADEALAAAVARRTEAATDKNAREGRLAERRQELAVARARREDAAARHRHLASEGERLEEARRKIDEDAGEIGERRATQQAEIDACQTRHAALQERFDAAEDEVRAAKERRESLRESSAGRRGRLDLLRERLDSHLREIERLEHEVEESRRQAAEWDAEAEGLAARRIALGEEMERAERELQEALEGRSAAEGELLAGQERLDGRRAELRELERQVTALREEREGLRETIEGLRIQEAELRQELGYVAATFREEFGREIGSESLDEQAATDLPRRELPELEVELASIKATLERLGPVNVLAVEEYEEQEERHSFLVEQRRDVEESVASLKRTIREINETSSERFRETFTEVNRSFGELFTQLFRGGEAEMRLQDEDDVLESGIEIVARPPGKRLQNLMLLSGGEKALTAIALLFGLFRTKPSPFCILDEVDAPLDDANTVRFVELLKEMAAETQFLVITHNKITMEVASTLYGVTMEERGVSKLVSVELDAIHPEEARATA